MLWDCNVWYEHLREEITPLLFLLSPPGYTYILWPTGGQMHISTAFFSGRSGIRTLPHQDWGGAFDGLVDLIPWT